MADAPRLKAIWQRINKTSVLTMKREDWESLENIDNENVAIDISFLPISRANENMPVQATILVNESTALGKLSVYRHDEKDFPYVINTDHYEVWKDVGAHPDINTMIERGSTANDQNFQDFRKEHVIFVKKGHEDDHWLKDLPISVYEILKST